ncbi:hypothetical protein CVT26_000614 [Gymnopilus dilepis]|uniref:DUF6533 domain-containing protein n=1 Tax=Gymnopilus dilepis TaxID=231916 RepID=A0A409Y2A0_9AGAR|nr:hypothetical protein CVT26_000614 [Gymnopilus dilepis]
MTEFTSEQGLLESLKVRKWSTGESLPIHAGQALLLRLATVATLAFLLYEHAITFRGEVVHIWRRPFTMVRATFIFARYFTLVVQTVNLYLVFGPFSRTSIPGSTCKQWFLFQIASACAIMAALDLILMLMVYALYRKSRRVGLFLALLFWAQIAVDFATSPKSVLDVNYNSICDTTETHGVVIYFCLSVWITHLSLAGLTGYKKNLLGLGAPVVRRVLRDGTWILVVVCSLFTVIIPYAFVNQVSQAHVVFGWPTAILSIACCRIIINMRTCDHAEIEEQSIIELDARDNLQLLLNELEQTTEATTGDGLDRR